VAVYSVPAGRPAAVRLEVTDPVTGSPVNLQAAPTVTVRNGAGTQVHTGTASQPGQSTGVYTFTIPGSVLPADALDVFDVEWSGTLPSDGGTHVEHDVLTTAGGPGRYFTVAELRAYDRAFADEVDYPAARIEAARVFAEQRIESVAEVAFVPRPARHRVDLRDGVRRRPPTPRMMLPDEEVREVYSVLVDGVALNADDWTLDVARGTLVYLLGGAWPASTVVDAWYTHGLDYPPEPVRRAAMMLAVDALVPTYSPRATLQSTDVGHFRISVADRVTGSTGIPEVDAVCAKFGRQRPHAG